jgi:hypothetical protein
VTYKSFCINKKAVILFGTCGLISGIAEIAWIYAYSLNHSILFSEIGNEITKSLFTISIINEINIAEFGLFIHIILSIFIGIVFGVFILNIIRHYTRKTFLVYFCSISTLMLIWLLAYNVMLPRLNPKFISLIPPDIAMYSKIGFGVIMAILFQYFFCKKRI